MDEAHTYSVSKFIAVMNAQLGQIPAQIIGEISQLTKAASGHRYFTLKDKETGYILDCTIWARDYLLAGVELEVGMEIAATGKANFYGPFGKLSFNTRTVELVGEGALKMAYEKLKKKLTLEGVFAPERKRELPSFPQKIGIITSLHGAVIHDFSNNLGKFGFKLLVLNSKVEGPESGRELALSVRAMRSEDIDVLVIIRGGGSIQSLAGFDNEALVREIVSFPVPVLAGVGHHQDITLAAMAADAAESTPSFVAALINRSWEQALLSLTRSEDSIIGSYELFLEQTERSIDICFSSIKDSLERILGIYDKARGAVQKAVLSLEFQFKHVSERIEGNAKTILQHSQNRIQGLSQQLESTARLIQSNDPKRQLKFGYSIVYKDGKIVRSVQGIKKGETLSVQVADGAISAAVLDNT
jgi:exodeoxyribonuclease VII large subunit